MKINEATKLAHDLMAQYNLTDWKFAYDRARQRLGLTRYNNKTIYLSKVLTALNPVEQVRNTILHEIAHALVGADAGHSDIWRNKAISIDCNGQRCTNSIVKVETRFKITCLACNSSWGVHRRPKSLMGVWHHNCGKGSLNRLVLSENP